MDNRLKHPYSILSIFRNLLIKVTPDFRLLTDQIMDIQHWLRLCVFPTENIETRRVCRQQFIETLKELEKTSYTGERIKRDGRNDPVGHADYFGTIGLSGFRSEISVVTAV